jgi:hypothetical protein
VRGIVLGRGDQASLKIDRAGWYRHAASTGSFQHHHRGGTIRMESQRLQVINIGDQVRARHPVNPGDEGGEMTENPGFRSRVLARPAGDLASPTAASALKPRLRADELVSQRPSCRAILPCAVVAIGIASQGSQVAQQHLVQPVMNKYPNWLDNESACWYGFSPHIESGRSTRWHAAARRHGLLSSPRRNGKPWSAGNGQPPWPQGWHAGGA